MGTYERRIQAPEKSLNADWVPEEGELFKNGANLYMGDNTTASNALTPINGGGSAQAPVGLPYTFSTATDDSDISNYRGLVRINNVNPASATTMWIAQGDAVEQDRGTVLNTLSAGGLVYINTAGEDGVVGVFRVKAMVDSGTYYTLTVDNFSGALPNDGAEVRVTIAPVEVTGVKRACFRITQTDTDAPVIADTLYNSLGETPSFQYVTHGQYTCTGNFPAGKTLAEGIGWQLATGINTQIAPNTADIINVLMWFEGAQADTDPSTSITMFLRIEVYP